MKMKKRKKCPMFRPGGVIDLLDEDETDVNLGNIGMHLNKKIIAGKRYMLLSDQRGIIVIDGVLYQLLPVIVVKLTENGYDALKDAEIDDVIEIMKNVEIILGADGEDVPAYHM